MRSATNLTPDDAAATATDAVDAVIDASGDAAVTDDAESLKLYEMQKRSPITRQYNYHQNRHISFRNTNMLLHVFPPI